MHNFRPLRTKNMIRYNDHKQQQLFDPWEFLGEKRRKRLDTSWSGIFQKEILPILPIRQLFPFFSATSGRPTKELYTVIGVLIFQQAFDLTDQETIEQISFNIQWCQRRLENVSKALDKNALGCPQKRYVTSIPLRVF
jgi:hypothetical protein